MRFEAKYEYSTFTPGPGKMLLGTFFKLAEAKRVAEEHNGRGFAPLRWIRIESSAGLSYFDGSHGYDIRAQPRRV